MPTRRHPLPRSAIPQITPEILALFARALALEKMVGGLRNILFGTRPKDAPKRAEHMRLSQQIHRLLALPPWAESVLDVADKGPPPSWMSGERASRYHKAQAIRQALVAALAAADEPRIDSAAKPPEPVSDADQPHEKQDPPPADAAVMFLARKS
jgi:hypothetical protein